MPAKPDAGRFGGGSPAARPRSLAEDLRSRDAAAIERLLVARPDLRITGTSSTLGLHAGSPQSVQAALDGLNHLQLQVLVAACLSRVPIDDGAIMQLMPDSDGMPAQIHDAIEALWDQALLWGSRGQMHVSGAARARLVPLDPTRDGPVVAADEALPQGLLPLLEPEPRAAPMRDARVANSSGLWLAMIHAVAEIGAAWGREPPETLRTGGLSQRDLTRTANRMSADEASAALWLELALTAGFIVAEQQEERSVLRPTQNLRAWEELAPGTRVRHLLCIWRDMTTSADLTARPLAPRVVTSEAAELRARILRTLSSPNTLWTDEEILTSLQWSTPRRFAGLLEPAQEILAQIHRLGLVLDAVPSPVIPLLLGRDADGLDHALAQELPEEVDRVILQADLTATVPGIPRPDLARLLRASAQLESRGAASVYRFTPRSIATALAEGHTPAELEALLASHGGVPQALSVLIADTARRSQQLP
jgi:hypothetical protein